MLYCEKCRALVEGRCEKREHTVRTPRDEDPVLLFKGDSLLSGQLEDMLRQQDIPFLKEGMLGAGMSTWTGPMLEVYSFYVPWARMKAAEEIAMVLRPVPPPQQE